MDQPISEIRILIKNDDAAALAALLSRNSNLPGKMANLRLAGEVQKQFSGLLEEEGFQKLYHLATALQKNEDEYVRMVTARAFGAIGKGHLKEVVPHIKTLANDDSWRVREGAAEGIGQLLCYHYEPLYQELKEWVDSKQVNLQRAAAVGMISMMSYDETLMKKKTEDALDLLEPLLTNSEEYVFKNTSFAINISGWKNPGVVLAKMERWLKEKTLFSSPTALKILINSLDSRFGKQNAQAALAILKQIEKKAEAIPDTKEKNKITAMVFRLNEKLNESA